MADSNSSAVAPIYADTGLHDVLVASGYGVTISVRSGHLIIVDGIGRSRRERKIARLPRTVQRLTILGHTGYLSLEAIRWLADADISWSQLSGDGDIIATSAPQRTDARLLRAQAAAPDNGTGLAVTRALLGAKLTGQAANLRTTLHAIGAAIMIEEYATELARCTTLDGCRSWEGQAAQVYWQALADHVSLPFSPGDLPMVPAHWRRFDGRTSLAWDGYRKNIGATDPVNAMLNYAYRIAETEAVHALHALGLHPALGILHADKAGRDSMALDLIEVIRPQCDALILAMLDCGLGIPYDAKGKPRYLDRRWLTETREGHCRLVPPLTHQLANHAAYLGSVIRPHAERVAKILAGAAIGDVRLPQPKASTMKAASKSVPLSSKMPARLLPGVTVSDLVPDSTWIVIRDLIPEPPKRPGSRKGGPVSVSDREVVAVLAAHELLAVPWNTIPIPLSRGACRGRLLAWQWSDSGGVSAWDRISGELQAAGHLSGLVG